MRVPIGLGHILADLARARVEKRSGVLADQIPKTPDQQYEVGPFPKFKAPFAAAGLLRQ